MAIKDLSCLICCGVQMILSGDIDIHDYDIVVFVIVCITVVDGNNYDIIVYDDIYAMISMVFNVNIYGIIIKKNNGISTNMG